MAVRKVCAIVKNRAHEDVWESGDVAPWGWLEVSGQKYVSTSLSQGKEPCTQWLGG
jgi:hypothetical protein